MKTQYISVLLAIPMLIMASESPNETTLSSKNNSAPVILTDSLETSIQNEFYGFKIKSFDEDNDDLTYSYEGLPVGLTISKRGYINGTPFEAGTFDIKITLNDGSNTINKTLTLNVLPAPDINELLDEKIEIYPNPFKNNLTVHYTLAEDHFVDIKLFSSHGELIKTLVNQFETKGDKQLDWDVYDENGKKVNKEGWFILQINYYDNGDIVYSENRRLFRLTRSQYGPMW